MSVRRLGPDVPSLDDRKKIKYRGHRISANQRAERSLRDMPEPLSAAGATPARMGVTGRALRAIGERTAVCFRVVFANGSSFQNREGTPAATFTFHTAAAEWRVW